MVDVTDKIERYVEGMDYGSFREDEKTADAVLRNLEVLGEASQQIPPAVQGMAPTIPWSTMAKMRDRLIHGYGTVDLEILWQTVDEEIPEVRSRLRTLISRIEDQ